MSGFLGLAEVMMQRCLCCNSLESHIERNSFDMAANCIPLEHIKVLCLCIILSSGAFRL